MTDTPELQPTLVKMNLGEFKAVNIELDKLPPDHDLVSKPVTMEFLQDIDYRGVLEAIVIADTEKGIFVISGSRRIKAARMLNHPTIKAMRGKMALKEAILARSAANNQKSANALADIQSIQFALEQWPNATVSTIVKVTGINSGRVKSLFKMAKLPKEIIDGIIDGHVSEETARKLSRQGVTGTEKAVAIYRQKKMEYARKKADGETVNQHPVFLTEQDLVKIQQVRVAESAQDILPDFLGNLPGDITLTPIAEGVSEVILGKTYTAEQTHYLVMSPEHFIQANSTDYNDIALALAVAPEGSTIWIAHPME